MKSAGQSLKGKVALVTGAGRGMGRSIALRFSTQGATVAVNDIQTDLCEAVAAEIRSRSAIQYPSPEMWPTRRM